VDYLAGTARLADDIPTGVTNKTIACPGRLSLSLFVPQRKKAPKRHNTTKHARHSSLHQLFRFVEWREAFLILMFCIYDDLPSLILKTLLHR
jgi:hypothetical protein